MRPCPDPAPLRVDQLPAGAAHLLTGARQWVAAARDDTERALRVLSLRTVQAGPDTTLEQLLSGADLRLALLLREA